MPGSEVPFAQTALTNPRITPIARRLTVLFLALIGTGCLDFDGALKDCADKGLCPADSGASGGGGGGGGGGAAGGVGGGAAGGAGGGVSTLLLTAPSGVQFGSVLVGDAGTLPFLITNQGASVPDLAIASSNPALFQVISACGSALASSANCTVSVRFLPATNGQQQARLTASGGGMISALDLQGIGVTTGPSFDVTPNPLAFPDTDIDGGSQTRALTVRNTGGVTLNNVVVELPMPAPSFTLKNALCNGNSLTVGSSCTTDVVFAPSAEGQWDASVAVAVQGLATKTAALSGLGYSSSGTYLLTVNLADAGLPSGTVVGNGINCPPDCSEQMPSGTSTTLTAVATPLFATFLGWDGGPGLSCDGGTCLFTAKANTTVEARFARFNRIFATSLMMPGSLNRSSGSGADAGDALCAAIAADAGLGNASDFGAWLADSRGAPEARLGTSAFRGWVGLDGLPFADLAADLTAGRILYPMRTDEHGTTLPPYTGGLWTGSGQLNCSDWTASSPPYTGGIGSAGRGGMAWSTGSNTYCNATYRLACLEHRYNTPLPPRPGGRRAFLSVTSVNGAMTVPGANTVCQNEARDAGLPNTFSALLRNGSSLGTGLGAAGGPWFRPDGVQLLATAQGLFATDGGPNLMAPIGVTARGTYPNYASFAWTGGGLDKTSTPDCQSWTTTDAGPYPAIIGTGQEMGTTGISVLTSPCSSSWLLYCFEQ
jgi:hypothetical protein